ncbi:uncharacterized protein C1orf159 homolog [Malurus melanocephalus]|uniref:uncharacterized protein C1orf159 homolog n=1 Tax=Malurus melanocephalus TaxID=175006 RepID=UPI002549B459|nr:uncharacterized protein C1orf159 homolog [Malurus melanocephalus]
MEVPLVLLLTRLVAGVAGKSPENSLSDPECCVEMLDSNSSCPVSHHCSPGCYRRWNEDGSSSCVRCGNGNRNCSSTQSEGGNSPMNASTERPTPRGPRSPEVAVSLILGSFSISLVLILAVASFFYLKRSKRLPRLFYRQNKASVLQPSETASMIPPPTSSVRKPRYVRRERSLGPTTPMDTRVSNV